RSNKTNAWHAKFACRRATPVVVDGSLIGVFCRLIMGNSSMRLCLLHTPESSNPTLKQGDHLNRNYSAKLSRKAFLILSFATGFVSMIGSLSAQQFMDVTDTAFPNNTPTPSFGSPIWGDIDNDG